MDHELNKNYPLIEMVWDRTKSAKKLIKVINKNQLKQKTLEFYNNSFIGYKYRHGGHSLSI